MIMRASIVIGVVLQWTSVALALPEDAGPLKVQELSRTETVAGKLVHFDLYAPEVAKPYPIVALGHGFARSRLMMGDWGRLLASRGYVAVAPDFPFPGADHATDGKILSALLDWLVAESQTAGSALAGRVDGSRRGVMGHSAGGLASLLAASTDSKINVMVGLDPVDVSDLGKTAAAAVKVPVTFVRAKPADCNSAGNAAAMFAGLAGPALTLEVVDATHCDPEWPSDPACSLLCGAADDTRRTRFVRYAMATLDYVLQCDKTMAPWLGGASATTDTLAHNVAVKGGFPTGQLGCAATPDAGADLGRRDGGTARDGVAGDSRPDAAPSDSRRADTAAPAPASSDSGCGCLMPGARLGARLSAPWPAALLVLLALVAGRRRRRS